MQMCINDGCKEKNFRGCKWSFENNSKINDVTDALGTLKISRWSKVVLSL